MNKIKTTPYYMLSTVLFVACLLISNVAAVKTFAFGPWTLPAAVILFPITYIVNDLLSEVYGYQRAKFTIMLGFAMNVLMVAYFALTIRLPHPEFFTLQEAYASILGSTPRIMCASMAAYLVGTTLNAKIMVSMRDASQGGKGLFVRCIASTFVGESMDSLVFIVIGFLGNMPLQAMVGMIFTQATFKTLYEVFAFPLTKLVVDKFKKLEGM